MRVFPVLIILLWFCTPVQGQRFSHGTGGVFREADTSGTAGEMSCLSWSQCCKGRALRLDSREGVLKGSSSGTVVTARQPDKSRLIEVLRYQGEVQMPPVGKLTDAEIKAFEKWIEADLP